MLTDQQCKAAKAESKAVKLSDAHGLHLYVSPSGYKSWRLKYRFGGMERRIVFGPYPDISLRQARQMRDDARPELRDGRDPGDEHKRNGLVPVLRRSALSLCHLGFEGERADAAQI